jgi:hypothetical protein
VGLLSGLIQVVSVVVPAVSVVFASGANDRGVVADTAA